MPTALKYVLTFFFQTLNPNVEAPSSLLLSHLSSLLYSSLPAFAETEAGNGKTLSISGSMSGGLPFSWQFHCTPAPHDVVGPPLSVMCSGLLTYILVMGLRKPKQFQKVFLNNSQGGDSFDGTPVELSP